MAKATSQIADGTSYYFVSLQATPKQLVTLFPNSFEAENTGEDKVNFDFTLETEDGDVFTLYDWKEYRRLQANEVVEWHIGAKDRLVALKAKQEVTSLLYQLQRA